jgi:hypothetical protein
MWHPCCDLPVQREQDSAMAAPSEKVPTRQSKAIDRRKHMKRSISFVALVAGAVFAAACSDSGAPGSNVAVRIGTTTGLAASSAFTASGASMSGAAVQDVPLEGSNGRLTITDMWVIVEELELEPVEVGDCDDDVVEVECPDFELRYLFVQVPVDGSDVQIAVTDAEGQFDELEIEVEDAEVDDDDADDLVDAQLIEDMFTNEILPRFPSWPEEAIMVVVGTFEPKNQDGTYGDPVDFTTYFEAEVEIELDLNPPFDSATDSEITVNLNLESWFKLPDGTVMDLAALQGQLVELEVDGEDGFEVEIDDD